MPRLQGIDCRAMSDTPQRRRTIVGRIAAPVLAAALCSCATKLWEFRQVPATATLTTSPATLPARWSGGFILVEASIDGAGPWSLILDTGASVASVAPRVADALHLVRGRFGHDDHGVALGGAAGTEVRVRNAVRLGEVRVGALVLRDLDALLLDVSGFERVAGVRIDGILPITAFHDVLLTLDGPANRVTVERGELPPADGADVLPLDGRALPHVTIDLCGTPCSVLLDSGSTEFVAVPEARASALRFRSPPVVTGRSGTIAGPVPVRCGRLDGTVSWGRHGLADPILAITPAETGAAGLALFSQFRTTFDSAHGRVRFERDSRTPIESRAIRSPGAGFYRAPDAWTVAYVLDEGPADRAGLRVGDRIDQLEGLPIAQVGAMYEILVMTSPALRMRVTSEGGTAREVVVPVATLVE